LPGITRNPRPNRSFLLLNYCLVPEPLVDPLVPGGVMGAGVVVLPEVLPPTLPPTVPLPEVVPLDVPPTVPPVVAPAPAPLRTSSRHFSRSVPVKWRHLFSASIFTVPEALVPAPLLVPLGVETVPPADAPPPTEDWAKAAADRAKNAAAVAAVIAFNIICVVS
jgi:hypothetical protein